MSPGSYNAILGWTCWFMFLILALRRLKQKDLEFEASQNYTGKPCLQKWGLFIMYHSLHRFRKFEQIKGNVAH